MGHPSVPFSKNIWYLNMIVLFWVGHSAVPFPMFPWWYEREKDPACSKCAMISVYKVIFSQQQLIALEGCRKTNQLFLWYPNGMLQFTIRAFYGMIVFWRSFPKWKLSIWLYNFLCGYINFWIPIHHYLALICQYFIRFHQNCTIDIQDGSASW